MDITTAVVPAHDFQTSTDLDLTETDLLLQCFEDVDLSFFPLNEDHNALVLSSHNQQYDDPINSLNDNNHGDLVIYEEEDPLNDPYIWALCNGEDNDHGDDINNNNNLLESLCTVEESSGHGINGDDNYEDEYAMYLVPQSRYNNCSLCHKLRQITHTNGSTSKAKRLEIHGIIGIITHVVVEKYDFDSNCFQIQECKIFDFQRENAQVVKGFLCKYLKACEEEGYTSMIHEDPLTTFYEAMCVGLNDDHCYNNTMNDPADDFQQFPQGNNNSQDYQNEAAYNQTGGVGIRSSSIGSRSKRTSLSVQRERTKRLKMQDLMEYFDIRMEQAAKKLNVCPTVVKKLCRRNGIERWPFRKVRSLKKNIAKKTDLLNSSGDEGKIRLQADILIMEQELAQIYETIY